MSIIPTSPRVCLRCNYFQRYLNLESASHLTKTWIDVSSLKAQRDYTQMTLFYVSGRYLRLKLYFGCRESPESLPPYIVRWGLRIDACLLGFPSIAYAVKDIPVYGGGVYSTVWFSSDKLGGSPLASQLWVNRNSKTPHIVVRMVHVCPWSIHSFQGSLFQMVCISICCSFRCRCSSDDRDVPSCPRLFVEYRVSQFAG